MKSIFFGRIVIYECVALWEWWFWWCWWFVHSIPFNDDGKKRLGFKTIPPSSTSFFFRFQMNHQLDGMSKKKLPSISTQKPKHRINKWNANCIIDTQLPRTSNVFFYPNDLWFSYSLLAFFLFCFHYSFIILFVSKSNFIVSFDPLYSNNVWPSFTMNQINKSSYDIGYWKSWNQIVYLLYIYKNHHHYILRKFINNVNSLAII